ncbi:hypothetical protein K435DRAFT_784202 [Dendrothele bispora CBS 962.96]|uniref:Uncharacterized protein n=1 Tax=Dendrothele bispora (strain CBS 962.96) TaxID=1314807 RepID=A0A4S8L4A8_DENBC|nr:hypothetical protein K435DRAFT_784202 [Dendrothele bispora CBS 962.96]
MARHPRLFEADIILRSQWLPPRNEGRVHLEHLTSLTLVTPHFEALFTEISAPVLAILSIYKPAAARGEPVHQWPQKIFLAFLSRNSSSDHRSVLESLTLDSVGISDIQLLEILQSTPNLKSLKVREDSSPPSRPLTSNTSTSPLSSLAVPLHPVSITNNLLRRMTVACKSSGSSSVTPPLVPLLHTIDLVTHPSSIDYGVLLDMVASRSKLTELISSPVGSSSGSTVRTISPLRNVSVRQGFIMVPDEAPDSYIPRPAVYLEPVMLTEITDHYRIDRDTDAEMGTGILDAGSLPDPSLLGKNEYFSVSPLCFEGGRILQNSVEGDGTWRKHDGRKPRVNTQNDADGDFVERMKNKIFRCFWWGGSVITRDFSLVRLVSSLGR